MFPFKRWLLLHRLSMPFVRHMGFVICTPCLLVVKGDTWRLPTINWVDGAVMFMCLQSIPGTLKKI